MRKIQLPFFTIFLFLLSLPVFPQKLDMGKFKDLKPRSIGPSGMSGRVVAIDAVWKDPSIIYIGTASGGLWKSTSGGVKWEPIFDREKVAAIGSMAIDQSNPDILWVGTGEGNPRNSLNHGYGIFKSLDAGKTWNVMGLQETRNIHRVLIDPTNPNVVYAGAIGSPWGPHPDRGLFKTIDGGKTWKKILFTNEQSGVADMVMDPSNPNKLFVAMWEHHRWPWFFKSGGEGSGLFVTFDGGDNWKKLGEKEGIPKGELGRIGLAISRSMPNVVYAIIEAKENALFRSEDGGGTWTKMGERNIGDRPFYYSEIYVDPKNENRVYTLFSSVNVSEDGGKTFTTLIRRSIHPDHHAWWIHPENPDYMIDGNDGGMAITYDRGKTWRLVENLPVGQFYHIRLDNELPYNVYGGMQDNGSWRGPAYTWTDGGIINQYWDDLMGGDGFDAMPDYSNPRYCYAMSQGGNVGRIDLLTGFVKDIQPVHPEGIRLRFNWNAAIAVDPFDPKTIYFGSQFLHKSTDRGDTWEIISPDLTTNDKEKQKYSESGGLTYDVTGAETHTTIIAIAPSPVQQGEIWVGTDDGNVQLTTDGGNNWKNVVVGLKDLPANSWIPHIYPSTFNAGEAFVVANNYRRNDWNPYVYCTTDYGKKWTRIVDESQVFGYCLAIVQDPLEPKLLFLGAEDGLYISIDHGTTWTKWTNNYPTVPTMDLAIHPREHDLVMGTFGRSVYVLDDIRPLRELAARGTTILDQAVKAFKPPLAYIVESKNLPGVYEPGDGAFAGDNRPTGAMITFSVKEGMENPPETPRSQGFFGGGMFGFSAGSETGGPPVDPKNQLKISIYDAQGTLVRTLTQVPHPGMNRISWGLDTKGTRFPGQPKPQPNMEIGGGPTVLPGTYKLVFSYRGSTDSTLLTVRTDPRMTFSAEVVKNNEKILEPYMNKLELLAEGMDRINEARNAMDLVSKQMPEKDTEETKLLKDVGKATTDSLKAITKYLEADRSVKGLYRNPDLITSDLYSLRSIMNIWEPLNNTQLITLKQVGAKVDKAIADINRFFETQWLKYREAVDKAKLTPFKDYEPLK